ncbi:enoyl-CoA hydratase/isomerase family protein [Leucobacter sp. HY1908]
MTTATSTRSFPQTGPEEVRLRVAGGVATIELRATQRRNSFTTHFMDCLLEAVEAATGETSVRVLIVTGGDTVFSVGGDLPEFAAGEFAPAHLSIEESAAVLRRHALVSELLRGSSQVSIAAIAGPCAGAGLSLAAACDLRVAATSAVFRTAFLDAALASDFGGLWLLTELLGEARAKSLFLLNPKVSAEEAHAIGLVSHVVSPDELESHTATLAASLASKAPLALGTLKRLTMQRDPDFSRALDRESLAQKRCAYSADAREAAAAFVERRTPRFSGR